MTEQPENSPSSPLVDACYRMWSDELVRYAWSLTRDWNLAQDAVASSFLAFAQAFDGLPEGARKAWLYKVTFRQAVRLRDQHRKSLGVSADPQSVPDSCLEPVGKLIREEDLARAMKALDRLPVEQREIVRLRIYEEKSFSEIASQLQIPLGTALSRMRLALERIRDTWKQNET